MDTTFRPSPPALAVLSLLKIGPLHPYGMQRLIKAWGKDQVVNVGQRANLYKTIKRLHEAGLIAIRHTERDQQYPERTVYELTDLGREAGRTWLADMLATPRNEFPEFPAALSFIMLLDPETIRSVLERRLAALGKTVADLDADLAQFAATVPRVALLETEYQRAVVAAEVAWLTGVIDDLKTGKLTVWAEEFEQLAKSFLAD
jgi:DNA-binding PadR family transcriptional regulator